ncbi:MAG: type 4a pilus biogenesis protein PilO [Candidatus Omnitrophica bacterium]|nr:type 4a pilus biogenesis protein PilO [Candidatus Omnitrophota bacterium]
MSKTFSSREKTIFFITIVVFLFAILFNIALVPILNYNEELNKSIMITRAKLERYAQLLGQKDSIKNKYSQFSSQLNLSEKKEDRLIEVLSELEKLAKGAGVRIVDIRPEGSFREAHSYKELLIDVKTEGSIPDFTKFMYNLENSLSLLKIKKFKISSKPHAQTVEGTFSVSQLTIPE